jgi:hypothetical protein
MIGFKKQKVVRIDMDSEGHDIVTLQDEQGQLSRFLAKKVPKELLAEYKGEVYNKRRI